MTAPLTDEQLDQLEESWRVGRPLPGAVRLVLAELRRLREENATLKALLILRKLGLEANKEGQQCENP